MKIVKNRVYHIHCVDNEYVFLGIANGMTEEGAYKFIDWFNPKVTWAVDPTNINQEISREVKKDCKAVRRRIKYDGSISE